MKLKTRDVTYDIPDKEPFLEWLAEHENEIASGTAVYQGQTITANSKATRYFGLYALGFWAGSQLCVSSYFLVGSGDERGARILWTLDTLLFGGWGWAFLRYQLSALIHNICGGEPIPVADLIEALHDPAKAEALSKKVALRANDHASVCLLLILSLLLILVIARAVILMQGNR